MAKTPGDYLRSKRVKLALTTRDVDAYSRQIAVERGNEDYIVSHARLVQIENGDSTPSVYKLYSLSVIYSCSIMNLLSLYIDTDGLLKQHLEIEQLATHILDVSYTTTENKITFPVRFDPGFSLQNSNLLSRMVEVWGEIPIALLQRFNLRQGNWGYIGMNDTTMSPLLRPGSFVQIESVGKPALQTSFRNDYERPIYFVELRDGYLCSWCEFYRDRLVSIPHPLSGVKTREFPYPSCATLIGRVTAVAARLVNSVPVVNSQGFPHLAVQKPSTRSDLHSNTLDRVEQNGKENSGSG